MKQQQIKYCRERAQEILDQKSIDLANNYRIESTTLSFSEKVDLIRRGKVSVKSKKEIENARSWDRTDISSVFDFSAFETSAGYKDGYDKALKKLKDQHSALADEIVLGDESKARELLDAFMKS